MSLSLLECGTPKLTVSRNVVTKWKLLVQKRQGRTTPLTPHSVRWTPKPWMSRRGGETREKQVPNYQNSAPSDSTPRGIQRSDTEKGVIPGHAASAELGNGAEWHNWATKNGTRGFSPNERVTSSPLILKGTRLSSCTLACPPEVTANQPAMPRLRRVRRAPRSRALQARSLRDRDRQRRSGRWLSRHEQATTTLRPRRSGP
ncbi:hypothetical protein Pan216_18250 [Planctomycetes bacterium Pan216]|uniref:Uncharacterized protein n=1 Tax=Kolteria novifilia TaxID=2527975 RepID=A0A518B1Z6_9BACT|nr:hypothetical protein Pan216_18250 [Planctomycetes bacterium Pan216]